MDGLKYMRTCVCKVIVVFLGNQKRVVLRGLWFLGGEVLIFDFGELDHGSFLSILFLVLC